MMSLEAFWNVLPHVSRPGRSAVVALMAIGLVGCDSGAVEPPAPGSVVVTTETTGFLQGEEYELFVDGVSNGTIGANAEVTVADLEAKDYEVSLGQMPDNCAAEAVTVTVEPGETANVPLTVTCSHAAPVAYTIQFNRERPDLDNEQVEVCPFGFCESDDNWDLYAYNNLATDPSSVIRQNQSTGVEIAHLPGVTLDQLSEADVAGASFTTDWVGDPFDAGRVILIRTTSGSVYALANPLEDTTNGTLRFDAALIATP